MWMVTVLVLLAGGLLGASNIVIRRRPDAKELIDKLLPYQGIIGIVMLLWGLHDVVYVFRLLGVLSSFFWLVFLVATLTQLCLGFLLGYGLIIKYVVGNNPQAIEKTERVRVKLVTYQGPLGVTAIVLAAIYFFTSLGLQ